MLIRCESCKRTYDFEPNDGLCPRCGCYNNITDTQARRLEMQRATRLEKASAAHSSLCDAQDNRTYMAGRYAPDCMEDSHDPRHAHTGGANLAQDGRILPPVPTVPLSMSRTPVRDSYARKVNGVAEPARSTAGNDSADTQKPGKKKSGCGILIAIFWVLFILLQIVAEM